MPIRLKQGVKEDFITFQIDCCVCGKPIEDAAGGAVVFKNGEDGRLTGEYWFVHKRYISPMAGGCFAELERRQGLKHMPWWELWWFLKALPKNMLDLDVSGDVTDTGHPFTVKKAKKRKQPIPFELSCGDVKK